MGSYVARRLAARGVDMAVVGAIFWIQTWWSLVAAVLLVLYMDAIDGGRGLGKRLFRIQVKDFLQDGPITSSQSAMRNFPFALLMMGHTINYVGWIMLSIGGLLVLMEVYFTFTVPRRLLDYYAGTLIAPYTLEEDLEELDI